MTLHDMFSKKSAVNSHWEVMLTLLTEKDPSQLTKANLARKIGVSNTTAGNIINNLHQIGFVTTEIGHTNPGFKTSKQYWILNTPHMLNELVLEITRDPVIAKNYSESYAKLKDRLPQKENIPYEHYYSVWKDLFNDDILQDFIKKTPSIMISFLLFFDLLLSIAEVDQSMAKDDLLANIPIPVRNDFFMFKVLPEDIFRLFIGLLQYNVLKLVEEIANLSFTKRLKLWFQRREIKTFKLSILLQELFKVDLSPKPSANTLNNRIMTIFYRYYEEYAEHKDLNDLLSIGKIMDFGHQLIKSNSIEMTNEHGIVLPLEIFENKDEIDLNKKSQLSIEMKDGSKKIFSVSFKTSMR